MNRVVLDYAQEIQAHQVGFARVYAQKSRPDNPSRFNKAISLHEYIAENAEAVGAEMAVAQFFGIRDFKPTLNTYKTEADVSAKLEVKWTKYDNGSLIIRKTDRPQDVAILVTGRSPVYQIMGWIPIQMARQPIYLNKSQDSHWITQRDLFPITDLRSSSYGSGL